MPNIRQFSVVIHDVPTGSKTLVQAALHKLAKKYVIALERYNHQEGQHLHLFYYLKSPSNILAQVRKWEAFKWGRVQVDPMRGTFDQASVYVISADKQKYQDPSPIIFPPINGNESRFCDCGYTTHMRYSFAAYQKHLDRRSTWVVADDPLERKWYEVLQERLDDWHTACICKKHKKFSRHANDIFGDQLEALKKISGHITNGQVHEESNEESVQEEASEEDQWYESGASQAETSGSETDESCDQ